SFAHASRGTKAARRTAPRMIRRIAPLLTHCASTGANREPCGSPVSAVLRARRRLSSAGRSSRGRPPKSGSAELVDEASEDGERRALRERGDDVPTALLARLDRAPAELGDALRGERRARALRLEGHEARRAELGRLLDERDRALRARGREGERHGDARLAAL